MFSQTSICPVIFFFPSAGSAGGAMTSWQSSTGDGVHCVGDCYYTSANVSQFEPHDVVVMAYKHHVVIHAQKVCICVRVSIN